VVRLLKIHDNVKMGGGGTQITDYIEVQCNYKCGLLIMILQLVISSMR